MKIPSKMGALLGKKSKLDDDTSERSLNLGDIVPNTKSVESPALTKETSPIASSAPLVQSEETLKQTPANSSMQPKPSSILDLDFMAAPLAEIEAARTGKEVGTAPIETMIDVAPAPIEAAMDNKQQDVMQAATDAVLTPAILSAQKPATKASCQETDAALAQSLRLDPDTGFLIFGPDGSRVDGTENFLTIVGITAQENASLANYSDLLRYMSQKADLGEKDVEALREKELGKMRERLAMAKPRIFNWETTMRSGRTLEFTNKYTTNRHLVSFVSDITERVEKDRLLRAGLELGTAGYWSYSFTTGKSQLGEYITSRLSTAALESVETHGLISIIHPDDQDRVQSEFNEAVQNNTRMDCEFLMQLDGGENAVMRMIGETELSTSSQEPAVFIAFLDDLTEDRNRAKELSDVKELSRNKSEFLARMSHEIKTPLNAIVGMTDALRDEVDNDEARETASFIADAAESLNTILSQTLEHERLSTSDIILDEDIVDLNEVVRSIAAMWKKPCAGKNLSLNVKISPDMPQGIKIDSSRFRQCLTNLISNAVKFTDSGSVVIAVAPMNANTPNPKVLVAVKDTGIGMSTAAMQNVFKPFKQGDATIQRRFGGSGLGMAITNRIVSAMSGQIKVKSAEGAGTTIAITFPLNLASSNDPLSAGNQETAAEDARPEAVQPAQAALPQAATSEPALNKIESPQTEALPAETFHPHPTSPEVSQNTPAEETNVRKNVAIVPSDYSGFDVLIVEDNPINQAVVKKLLTNHIRSMDFAFHGQEAMEILEHKSFDVILMDIHMPVKDGIETTIEIRNSGKAWADTVIVALTADPDYQQKRVCRNIGMNDALSKPVKRQELLDVMQRVLSERLENDKEQPVEKVA